MSGPLPTLRAELITTREAAEFLGVSERTVRRLREKGLPFVTLGGSVRFRVSTLRSWLDRQEQVVTPRGSRRG